MLPWFKGVRINTRVTLIVMSLATYIVGSVVVRWFLPVPLTPAAIYVATNEGYRQLVEGGAQARREADAQELADARSGKTYDSAAVDATLDAKRILHFIHSECVCADKRLYRDVVISGGSVTVVVDPARWRTFSKPQFREIPKQVLYNDIVGFVKAMHRGQRPDYMETVRITDAAGREIVPSTNLYGSFVNFAMLYSDVVWLLLCVAVAPFFVVYGIRRVRDSAAIAQRRFTWISRGTDANIRALRLRTIGSGVVALVFAAGMYVGFIADIIILRK